jgi:hypothetical protein
MNFAELESLAPGDLEELPDSYQAAPLDLLSFKLTLWELQRPAVAARVKRTGVQLSVTDITASQWWVLLLTHPVSTVLLKPSFLPVAAEVVASMDSCCTHFLRTHWLLPTAAAMQQLGFDVEVVCISIDIALPQPIVRRCGLQNAFQVATGQRKKTTLQMAAGSGRLEGLEQGIYNGAWLHQQTKCCVHYRSSFTMLVVYAATASQIASASIANTFPAIAQASTSSWSWLLRQTGWRCRWSHPKMR